MALNVDSRTQSSQIGNPVEDRFERNQPAVPLPVPAVPAGGWRSYVFIIPIVSATIATIGAGFSIRNWAYLDSKFTLKALNVLSPQLQEAHAEILSILKNMTQSLQKCLQKNCP